MVSLGIRCGGCGGGSSSSCSFRRHAGIVNAQAKPRSLVISNHSRTLAGISGLSISSDHKKFRSLEAGGEVMEGRGGGSRAAVSDRRLDEWMTASVTHIVKSLPEAPLFVQVYERSHGGGRRSVSLKTETEVEAGYWDVVRAKWEGGEMPEPHGLIFVEELFDDDDDELQKPQDGHLEGADQMWGIVVQAKGKGSGCATAACYLLKTTRVPSGVGFCAVHFYLTKVRNFKEKAKSQLKKLWLVQRPDDE
ncbi:hypothetical protein SAY87_009804 [Trapa incisa]|uniref:DUF7804 domain-containing protein n=1 Tax=Trapa incisa TaxID=236973 RepID=A0AAN7PXS4_9MYRT|nr:hypothetical protein SAY87_009804 [Trapa incisa]